MTTPFQAAGAADKGKQARYAPIWTNRFHTGLWTQRNPLRDAATQYLTEKFYSGSRYDSLIAGSNVELTTRLTLARRPGLSAYNSSISSPINRFYGFHLFSTTDEVIKVMADTATVVYDATGPSTATTVLTKSAGAGSTYFQSVGNTLYFGNGVDQKKWVQSTRSWAANTVFSSGTYIVDTNGNLQVSMGARSATISSVQVASNVCTVTFTGRVSLLFWPGMLVTLAGLTGATFLNSVTVGGATVNYNQLVFSLTHADYPATADTGTASTTGGPTGSVQPVWNTTIGTPTANGITLDTLDQQWLCKGPAVQNWGIVAPSTAPTAVNASLPSAFPDWAADTVYSPSLSIIDSNANIQTLTTGGTTGGVQPVWNITVGGTTADGTAVWTNSGAATWTAIHAYALDYIVAATWTYYITVSVPCFTGETKFKSRFGDMRFDEAPAVVEIINERGEVRVADLLIHDYSGPIHCMDSGELVTPAHLFKREGKWLPARTLFPETGSFTGKVYNFHVRDEQCFEDQHYVLANGEVAHNLKSEPDPSDSETIAVTASAFFQVTTAGTSGSAEPAWVDGVGSFVDDGSVQWVNIGGQSIWLTKVGANTKVSVAQIIIDSNGNKQTIITPGKSGATAPTWATTVGTNTVDNLATWLNTGTFSAPGTASWIYTYAFKNSVAGSVSTESPASIQVTLGANKLITVQGNGSSDSQVDTIQIYRTAQGGAVEFLLDEIASPGSTGMWTYTDTTPDSGLNELIESQATHLSDPPPAGLIALTYHLGKVWGAVGNTVYYSGGSSTLNGNGNEAFPPLNNFVFPSKVTRMLPNSYGLMVFTISDIYLISGLATANSPLFSLPFIKGIGLKGYDAFDVNGSIIYLMTADNQVLSLDPNSGISEIGFPIGDVLSTFNPSTAYVTWHVAGSTDKALYVSDGDTGWYRMSPTSAPETGLNWSPFASLGVGCSAVQSVEVNPGVRRLLVGSGNASTGKIYQRDLTVFNDGGTPYSAFATFGSIILAHPGQMAEMGFITFDALAVGVRPEVSVLLDEIAATVSVPFDTLSSYVNDPPLLAASQTLFASRYYFNQRHEPAWCRHLQIKFAWPTDSFGEELLSFTIYGALYQEK